MQLDDFLKEYVVGNDKDLLEKMESKQYPLSNNIMALETKLGFDQKKTADYLGISFEKLLKLEAVDLSIDVSEYENTVNKLLKAYWSNIKFNYSKSDSSTNEDRKKVNFGVEKEKQLELTYDEKALEVITSER